MELVIDKKAHPLRMGETFAERYGVASLAEAHEHGLYNPPLGDDIETAQTGTNGGKGCRHTQICDACRLAHML